MDFEIAGRTPVNGISHDETGPMGRYNVTRGVIFSLIQTATEKGLDPYHCLTWLLSSTAEMNLAQLDVVQTLLPWNAPG